MKSTLIGSSYISPYASMATEFIDPDECNRDYRYEEFLRAKRVTPRVAGLQSVPDLHAAMFPHQKDVTSWALRLGRAAAFPVRVWAKA